MIMGCLLEPVRAFWRCRFLRAGLCRASIPIDSSYTDLAWLECADYASRETGSSRTRAVSSGMVCRASADGRLCDEVTRHSTLSGVGLTSLRAISSPARVEAATPVAVSTACPYPAHTRSMMDGMLETSQAISSLM